MTKKQCMELVDEMINDQVIGQLRLLASSAYDSGGIDTQAKEFQRGYRLAKILLTAALNSQSNSFVMGYDKKHVNNLKHFI